MRYEPIGEARFAVDLSGSATRIRRHGKTPQEYVTGAYMYCLKVSDYDSALFLSNHMRVLEGEVGRAEVLPLTSPGLKSLREIDSELTESEAAA